MARIFKAPKYQKNPATGKHELVLDKHGNTIFHDKWRGDYVDHKGRRRIVTLGKTKPESQKQLDLLEAREREIQLGLRPAPSAPEQALKRKFDDVAAEYIRWGKVQGARGKPWSSHNLKKRLYYLDFWKKNLDLVHLGDLIGCLSKAEEVIGEYHVLGRAPSSRTRHAYREALIAFVTWCMKRKYLTENPFEAMATYDPTPKKVRRAMTKEEIKTLLDTVPLHRRVLYEAAFATGFRAAELRSLTVDHLDIVHKGIRLIAEVDKGRTARLQPVNEDVIRRLHEYAKSGDALERYKESFARARRPMRDDIPANPLLFLPRQTSVMIYADLKKAGVPIETKEGQLDFHACRTAFINMVIRQPNVDIKTVQVFVRHKRIETTMKCYAQPNQEMVGAITQGLSDVVLPRENKDVCTKSALGDADGMKTKNAIPLVQRDCMEGKMVGRDGFEPS